MNAVQLIGRLTKEIELRYTQQGIAVGTFSLAVNRNFTNQQGEREADFINCVIWRKAAENFANFTRKGSLVGVEGRLQVRHYDNQQGQRVYVTEVIVNNFDLLESKQVTEQRPSGTAQPTYTEQQPYHNQQYSSFGQYNNTPYGNGGNPLDIGPDDLPF